MDVVFEDQKNEGFKLKRSWQAYSRVLDQWKRSDILQKKAFKALLLTEDNHLIGRVSITDIGSLERSHLASIKAIALRENAASIIIAENDLDSDIVPSVDEKKEVQKLKTLSESLDMVIKDHMIVARDAYYSYADNGLIYSHP